MDAFIILGPFLWNVSLVRKYSALRSAFFVLIIWTQPLSPSSAQPGLKLMHLSKQVLFSSDATYIYFLIRVPSSLHRKPAHKPTFTRHYFTLRLFSSAECPVPEHILHCQHCSWSRSHPPLTVPSLSSVQWVITGVLFAKFNTCLFSLVFQDGLIFSLRKVDASGVRVSVRPSASTEIACG